MENELLVSVVIPSYNNEKIISRCLEAVENQSLDRSYYEIIVVNDGSIDNTEEQVKKFNNVQIISIEHSGPSVARNSGAKQAKGKILVFTDSDCIPTHNWLEAMTDPFKQPDIIGVKGIYCTNQTNNISNFVQLEYEYKYKRMKKQTYIDFIDTYSAAYNRDVFLANGGFDSTFTQASVEDQELSFRLSRKGYHMVFEPKAVVQHWHDETIKEYWQRKFGIGFWKAVMLRWLPEKMVSDSHTSPSQRWQILLLVIIFCAFILVPFYPSFIWAVLISIGLFFVVDISFLKFILKNNTKIGLIYPLIISVRAMALGAGLLQGFLLPPRYLVKKERKRIISYFAKRLMDVLGGLFGLIISAPILLFAIIAIRIDSSGPVFFSQIRAGVNGKPFRIFKLRTMVIDAEEKLDQVLPLNHLNGPVYKIRNDPRVTKVGKFLRKWSIDEFPQFWNVVKGEMSLVGPRPEEIWVVEKYTDEQRKRLAVKPGLTGPMQINGRGELDFDERLSLELEYLNKISLKKDILIILRSLRVIFSGKGAF